MPFQKNNKIGFTSDNPLDPKPVCLKVRIGVRDKLMVIPGWQDKIRLLIDQLIADQDEQD